MIHIAVEEIKSLHPLEDVFKVNTWILAIKLCYDKVFGSGIQ